MLDRNGWPIWNKASQTLQDAVRFVDEVYSEHDLGFYEAIELFHKKNNVSMPLEDFENEVEDLYYSPTAPHPEED